MRVAKIRLIGEVMGREMLAQRALEIAKEMVEDGSYKRAIKGAGQLKVISQACGFDEYWKEKAEAGEWAEHEKLLTLEESL